MKVKEVMVGTVVTCSANDDLNRPAQIMWENDCGIVPVVEGDDALVGMISDRDICMAAYTRGRSLSEIKVGDIMSREVKTCRADDDASVLSASMRAQRVRRVPVVNAVGRLVGIVSLSDLARRAAYDRGSASKGMSLDSVGETLASVCQPWSSAVDSARSIAPAGGAAKDAGTLQPQRSR
ncbi:MAG TPA: CBS domain-containing protein [Planctomycetota bacterium]|nr:CBS domain-containing protein [Planctomycetota bacterium]